MTIMVICGVFISPALPVQAERVRIGCPPELKMLSSFPSHNSTGAAVDTPIIFTWDKTNLEDLSDNVRDLKPALESINIAGGRYGMGKLLTTEWGIGGEVSWDNNREVITPDAPLEPGTQYSIWTYRYITIRANGLQSCPGIGGKIIFRTAGDPPDDGNPVREIDLANLYHGDDYGKGDLSGPVMETNPALHLMSIKDDSLGTLSLVVYAGTPLMSDAEFLSFEAIKPGDKVEVTFSGGRAAIIRVFRQVVP